MEIVKYCVKLTTVKRMNTKTKYPPKLLEFIKDKSIATGILVLMDYKLNKYTVNQLIAQYGNYK